MHVGGPASLKGSDQGQTPILPVTTLPLDLTSKSFLTRRERGSPKTFPK